MNTTKTYKLTMFYDDMGSYTTNCHDVEDALWHVNSARDHDGLPHMSIETLKRLIRKGEAKLTEI